MQATGLLHGSRRIAKRGQSPHAFFCGSLDGFFPRVRKLCPEPVDFFGALVVLGFLTHR